MAYLTRVRLPDGTYRDIGGSSGQPDAVTNITRNGTTFTATRADGTTFTFTQQDNDTWVANSASDAGYVAAGAGHADKVWKTNASGVPAWRDDEDTTYSDATTTTAGLMSAADKAKLDGIASGAEVNVQSNWNETDTTSDAYIQNKPTIPTDTWKAYYGTCSTAAGTAAKVVSVSAAQGFSLRVGTIVGVKFSNTNTYSNATDSPITLNVNSTGAKNIWYNTTHSGAGNTGTNTTAYGYANRVNYYMYDGTYWVWMNFGYESNTWTANSSSAAGYVASGSGQANKIWATNADGDPAWRRNYGITSITRSGTTFTATREDGTTFTFTQQDNNTWTANSADNAGYVAAGSGHANQVWKTNADGVPAWRNDANTWTANSADNAGYVAAGTGHANQVWKTNADGVPAWRNDANTWTANSSTAAGYVASGSGQVRTAWTTDANGAPAWREIAVSGAMNSSATKSVANNTNTSLSSFTVPTNGTYIAIGMAQFAANATGDRLIGISQSSSTLNKDRYSITTVRAANATPTRIQCVTQLLPGITGSGETSRTYYLMAYQSSGAALNVTSYGVWYLRIGP